MDEVAMSDVNLSSLSPMEFFKLEKKIAQRHLGHFPWLIVTWSITNFVVWLSVWPLVLFGVMPL